MIHDFWTRVWRESSIDVQEAAASLRRQFGQDRSRLQWAPLPLEVLEQAVKKAKGKGSGGADGWDCDELKFLPTAAVKCFHDLALRWAETTGTLPHQLVQARQVPLTVMTVWWRANASAWVHSKQMSEWTSPTLTPGCVMEKALKAPKLRLTGSKRSMLSMVVSSALSTLVKPLTEFTPNSCLLRSLD